MGSSQILPIQVKVNLGVVAIKGYTTIPKAPELKPHHLM